MDSEAWAKGWEEVDQSKIEEIVLNVKLETPNKEKKRENEESRRKVKKTGSFILNQKKKNYYTETDKTAI